ncbi:MAG: hypothetical protein ACRDL7_06025 [Gaiellaceae bacterium]
MTTGLEEVSKRHPLGRITHILENDFGTTRGLYYRYDIAGRLYGVSSGPNPADTVATYRYDLNGNRIAVNRPGFPVVL